MVGQLRRLTRPINTDEGNMLALAVYSHRQQGKWCIVSAKESGWEGVACVDDVARAAWLFLDVWEKYRLEPARQYAEGFLSFVRSMQQEDGRFLNFISDWEGVANEDGITSYPGGPWWTARAVVALARSVAVLGEEGDLERIRRAWPFVREMRDCPDTRTLHILAALDLERATSDLEWLTDVRTWADELMCCRDSEGCLLNEPTLPFFHFWGHIQPAALALAGARLQWPAYIDAAEQSARLLIEPMVRGGFAIPHVQPYDVSSCIFSLKTLYDVTRRPEYWELIHLARAWFRGRNPARKPVYDPVSGHCYDGVDGDNVNPHSGAESNIEAAFALFEELPWPYLLGDADEGIQTLRKAGSKNGRNKTRSARVRPSRTGSPATLGSAAEGSVKTVTEAVVVGGPEAPPEAEKV